MYIITTSFHTIYLLKPPEHNLTNVLRFELTQFSNECWKITNGLTLKIQFHVKRAHFDLITVGDNGILYTGHIYYTSDLKSEVYT